MVPLVGGGGGGRVGFTDDDGDAHWKVRIYLLRSPGVSLKIEVASRVEKSNQLYQQEAFGLLPEGSGGMLP